MKHLKIALLALFVVAGVSNLKAQDSNNSWVIGIGANIVDFYPNNGDFLKDLGESGDWNAVPSFSRAYVGRYLEKGFSVELGASFNRIDHVLTGDEGELMYFGLDGAVKYDLNDAFGQTGWFDPYALVGGGYTWLEEEGTGTANAGLGFNTWFSENVGLNVQTTYKHSFIDELLPHFQHSVGLTIKFGGTDTDGDGVYDKEDACPEVFGLVQYKGCPDADEDGIIDSEDACPNVAGLAELNGCPDADGDGIADKDDACPNAKGTKANGGCPDTDGDSVIDKKDACPTIAGPAANKGCPWPDTDGDGVLDKDDQCVNEVGPASNNGCPEGLSAEAEQLLSELVKGLLFDIEKSNIKAGAAANLDKIAAIMAEFDKVDFQIDGHADDTGSKRGNVKLSDKRANAVKDYLVAKGVDAGRLTTEAHGDTAPAETNKTRKGRAKNRRVEIKGLK